MDLRPRGASVAHGSPPSLRGQHLLSLRAHVGLLGDHPPRHAALHAVRLRDGKPGLRAQPRGAAVVPAERDGDVLLRARLVEGGPTNGRRSRFDAGSGGVRRRARLRLLHVQDGRASPRAAADGDVHSADAVVLGALSAKRALARRRVGSDLVRTERAVVTLLRPVSRRRRGGVPCRGRGAERLAVLARACSQRLAGGGPERSSRPAFRLAVSRPRTELPSLGDA